MRFHWDGNSLFARLLAKENISVVFDGKAKTASFDLKGRVLTLPNWDFDQDTVDAITAHEVSHALHTPFSEWKKAVDVLAKKHGLIEDTVHQYLNIVEDVRIEKLIKRAYPGLKRCFYFGYKKLHEDGIIKLPDNVKIEDLTLVDRINLHYKIGHLTAVPFSTVEEQDITKYTAKTQTFQEVVDIADKLLEHALKNYEKIEVMKLSDVFSDNKDVSESGASDKSVPGGSKGKKPGNGKLKEVPDKNVAIESKTDKSMRAEFERFRNKSGKGKTYVFNPKKFDKRIVPLKDFRDKVAAAGLRAKTNNIYANNKDIINYMLQIFNKRKSARAFHKSYIADSGDLNLKRLAFHKTHDNIFNSYRVIPNAKNHGLIAIVDCSGSMSDIFLPTMMQMINLATFCKKAGIPFSSYGFFSGGAYGGKTTEIDTTEAFVNVELINSMMNMNDFKHQCELLVTYAKQITSNKYGSNITLPYYLGGTPMIGSLLALTNHIGEFKEKYKIEKMNVVVLTDGGNTDYMTDNSGNSVGENDYIKYGSKKNCIFKCSDNLLADTITLLRGYHENINVIGMYLTNNIHISSGAKNYAEFQKDWEKHGFYSTTNEGFDRYYYMNTQTFCDVNVNTVNKAGDFQQMMKNKTKNKILINSLMEYLA